MNLQYHSDLGYSAPGSDREAARKAMLSPPRHGYGAAYGDNMRAMGDAAFSNYQRDADQANFNYAASHLQGQQGLALQGLQNLSQDQQRQVQMGASRFNDMIGALRGLV